MRLKRQIAHDVDMPLDGRCEDHLVSASIQPIDRNCCWMEYVSSSF